jgi:hypothetical protein
MTYIEVNDLLRTISRKIMSMGFKKTHIGRIIFGSGNYPMFLKFIDENKEQDFGIKPLERAGEVLNYKAHVVFIEENSQDPIVDAIKNKNKKFVIELEDYLVEHLSNQVKEKKTRKNSLDDALESILNL